MRNLFAPLAQRRDVNPDDGETVEQILARLALDRRDERTQLAIVEPERKLFPPEPFRYAGGSLIRRALVAKDAAEDEGREPSLPTRFVASLPRRLGLRLPR